MIVTEADLRDQLRCPTHGSQVQVPVGARLSPSASDFVKQWDIHLVTEPEPLLESQNEATHLEPASSWDKSSVFPVQLEGKRPRCICCGTEVTSKPSSLTQLNSTEFAPKTHPRIKLRGKVDSLHAHVLLVQAFAKQAGQKGLTKDLGTVAAYCRELTSAEYNERQVGELRLGEWDIDAIHKATHDPKGVLGIDHLTIDENDDILQHWLNIARTMSREIEIVAMEAFDDEGQDYGASICHAFNRLSSAFYFLQLRLKAGAE